MQKKYARNFCSPLLTPLCTVMCMLTLLLTGCTLPSPFGASPSVPPVSQVASQSSLAEQNAAKAAPPAAQNISPEAAALLNKAQKLWVGDSEYCTDPTLAISMLDAVLEMAPDHPEALLWRGRALSESHFLADAFDDLTRSIQIQPTAFAYVERALTGMRLGNTEGADSDLAMALQLNPKEPRAYFYRAGASFLRGEDKKACADLAKACRYGLCQPLDLARRDNVCR